jgi:branched-chain amino acid transport system substrate-binding protein
MPGKEEPKMKLRTNAIRIIGLLLALSFLFSACTAGGPKTYRIGLLDAMTGSSAVWGQSNQKGAELAIDEINKAGGVNGVPLELVTEDNRMAPADSVTGFKKLAEVDKVPVVIGISGSTVSFSTCPLTATYKIVGITTNATNPNLGSKCPPYFYRVMPDDGAQGPEMVKVLEYFKQTQAPILYINNDYGIGVRDAILAGMKAKGYNSAPLVQAFAQNGTDFRTEILKVKDLNPPATFLIGYTQEIGLILKQSKELGLNTQWIGEVDAVTHEVPDIAGAGAEGFVALYPGSRITGDYVKYSAAFQAKFGTAPTVWSEFAYDSVKLAAMAMQKGGYSGDGIQANNVVTSFYEWDIVKSGQWVIFNH